MFLRRILLQFDHPGWFKKVDVKLMERRELRSLALSVNSSSTNCAIMRMRSEACSKLMLPLKSIWQSSFEQQHVVDSAGLGAEMILHGPNDLEFHA